MALLQERFLRILQAGGNFKTQYELLKQSIIDEGRRARQGGQSWEDAFQFIAVLVEADRLADDGAMLQIEWMRYRLTHGKNEREKLRKRIQRSNFAQFVGDAAFAHQSPPAAKTAAEIAAEIDAEEETVSEVEPPPATMDHRELTQMERDVQDGLVFAEQWKKEKAAKRE